MPRSPGAMWRMRTGRSKDLVVTLEEHEADDTTGRARRRADYTFSNGNKVHNDVRARFRFQDGLIAEHIDSFSFHAWSRQALGGIGAVLGWTPLIRNMVRGKAVGLRRWRYARTAASAGSIGTSPLARYRIF